MLLFFRVGEKNEPDRFMAVTSGDFIFSKKSQTLTFQTMIISVIKLVRGFLKNRSTRYEHQLSSESLDTGREALIRSNSAATRKVIYTNIAIMDSYLLLVTRECGMRKCSSRVWGYYLELNRDSVAKIYLY